MRNLIQIVESHAAEFVYHGTIKRNVPDILKTGCEPRVGSLTAAYHKDASPLVYASDTSNKVIQAITFQMRPLVGEGLLRKPDRDYRWGDAEIAEHGAILVFNRADFEHRPWGDEDPRHPKGSEWEDYYTGEIVKPVEILTGQAMMDWLYSHKMSSTPEFIPSR